MDKTERSGQLVEEVRAGIEAEGLTRHKVWQDTIKELEDKYINGLRKRSWIKFIDGMDFSKKAREEDLRRLQVLDDLVNIIETKIVTGEQAQKRLEANKNGSKQRRN